MALGWSRAREAARAPAGAATAAPQLLVYQELHNRSEVFRIRFSGRVVQTMRTTGDPRGGHRGVIKGFSESSRGRMLRTLEAVPWEGPLVFVCLTYPATFPKDGLTVKSHLDRWKRRWLRKYGPPVGAWKFEFQERGAPHVHLLLKQPGAPLDDLRAWIAQTWADVVQAPEYSDHLAAGTRCELWRSKRAPGWYFAKYAVHESKQYQNTVPEGFKAPGRFWGLWNLKPDWQELEVPRRVWVRINRTLRELVARRGGNPRRRRGSAERGRWVAGGSCVGELAAAVVTQIESEIQAALPEMPGSLPARAKSARASETSGQASGSGPSRRVVSEASGRNHGARGREVVAC